MVTPFRQAFALGSDALRCPQVKVRHLLVKHQGARNPISWRKEGVAVLLTREEAAAEVTPLKPTPFGMLPFTWATVVSRLKPAPSSFFFISVARYVGWCVSHARQIGAVLLEIHAAVDQVRLQPGVRKCLNLVRRKSPRP